MKRLLITGMILMSLPVVAQQPLADSVIREEAAREILGYLASDQLNGRGNGLVSSAVAALNDGLQTDVEIVDYHEHALRRGSDAQAVAYVECRTSDDRHVFGVGIDDDVATASIKALLSAFNSI